MLLVGNGRLITQDSKNPYFENGGVLIEDGVVKELGDFKNLKEKYPSAKFIDAHGKVIMPGLINAHSHIYSAFARGMNLVGPSKTNFLEILEHQWWRLDKALTLEDTRYSAYTTLIDHLKFGVTTVFDHHAAAHAVEGGLFEIADVSKELGIRTNLAYELSDRDGEDIANQGIKENIDFIKQYNKDDQDMVKGMFGMHASFTISDKTMEKAAKEMAGLNAGYHIHVAEGIDDVHLTLKNHGKRVIERLDEFDILSDKTITVHCIYINQREMELVKNSGTNVVHNPESNMGNAVGCSPVIKMMAEGINVGLGTDGYTSDMFESMKVGNIIHKDRLCDPNVAWTEIPQAVHANNTTIASKYFSKPLGILKEGAFGDVIIIDYDPPTPLNETNFNSHILFGMHGRSVTHTIVGGKVLMEDRKVLVADEAEINAKSRELSKALWKRA